MKVNPQAITYKPMATSKRVAVYLRSKLVGHIDPVDGGFQYVVKGGRQKGDVFPTLAACKQSLEDE